jgi:hypothetical protein
MTKATGQGSHATVFLAHAVQVTGFGDFVGADECCGHFSIEASQVLGHMRTVILTPAGFMVDVLQLRSTFGVLRNGS